MYSPVKEFHTVDQIRFPVINRLIEILDLSPDNDWENIGLKALIYFNLFDGLNCSYIFTCWYSEYITEYGPKLRQTNNWNYKWF